MRAHADWWWDAAWNPVGGCLPVSPGCTNCVAPPWNGSHTHRNDVHRGVITKKNGRWTFNGEISDLPKGHPSWKFPLVWPGAEHPKLGPDRPSLIFVADMSDLFYEERPDEIISR